MNFNIFNNLVSFFLFKLKYVLKYQNKRLNVLILINRNSFSYAFLFTLWISNYAKRANFFPACAKLGFMSRMCFEPTITLSFHRNALFLLTPPPLGLQQLRLHCPCSSAYPPAPYHMHTYLTLYYRTDSRDCVLVIFSLTSESWLVF